MAAFADGSHLMYVCFILVTLSISTHVLLTLFQRKISYLQAELTLCIYVCMYLFLLCILWCTACAVADLYAKFRVARGGCMQWPDKFFDMQLHVSNKHSHYLASWRFLYSPSMGKFANNIILVSLVIEDSDNEHIWVEWLNGSELRSWTCNCEQYCC